MKTLRRNGSAWTASAAVFCLGGASFGAVADVKPVSLRFESVPEVSSHEFVQPAHQRVVLEFLSAGANAVGKTRQELCPNIEDDEFCLYNVFNQIAGKTATYQDAAVNAKRYQPGQSYQWELTVPPGTLKHCQKVAVWIDSKRTLGQNGAGVYKNDQAMLTARRIGTMVPCVPVSDFTFDEEE